MRKDRVYRCSGQPVRRQNDFQPPGGDVVLNIPDGLQNEARSLQRPAVAKLAVVGAEVAPNVDGAAIRKHPMRFLWVSERFDVLLQMVIERTGTAAIVEV